MSFESFGFDARVSAGIPSTYTAPTPIQQQAIPAVMQGKDVLGLAQTGTGKTAAFSLPILNRLVSKKCKSPRALIIAPTRELAEQIHLEIQKYGEQTGLVSQPIYGGVNMQGQIKRLRRGTDIVVACPGRLLDHMSQHTVDFSALEVLVLDEADQMFDMGFLPDIRRIIKKLPAERQNLLFSATMPKEVRHLTAEILRDPVNVQVKHDEAVSTIAHALYPIDQGRKVDLVLEILKNLDMQSVLVFTRTKHRAKRLGVTLSRAGYRTASLQGNLSQGKRLEAMRGFRDGTYQVLVATDIAARGIDVQSVSHVINFDMPDTVQAYTHRIGRTGRAARNGDAFTFVCREDEPMVRAIERTIGTRIERRALELPAESQKMVDVPRGPQENAGGSERRMERSSGYGQRSERYGRGPRRGRDNFSRRPYRSEDQSFGQRQSQEGSQETQRAEGRPQHGRPQRGGQRFPRNDRRSQGGRFEEQRSSGRRFERNGSRQHSHSQSQQGQRSENSNAEHVFDSRQPVSNDSSNGISYDGSRHTTREERYPNSQGSQRSRFSRGGGRNFRGGKGNFRGNRQRRDGQGSRQGGYRGRDSASSSSRSS